MNTRKDSLSRRLLRVPPSGIRRFFELLIGHDDVISLSVGEPDFATPWCIREEAFYHMERGHTSYTSNRGLEVLREEIARYMSRYGLNYSVDEILVTVGASEGVDAALRAVLNEGDEILVSQPCYVNYAPLAELAGARVVPIDTSASGFVLTADEVSRALTPRAKALMLCSPNNPTGTIIPRDELARIARIACDRQLWVIADEIYCELRYDGAEHVSVGSFPGMKDYAIILNGFSKAFAMTGWRIGWVAAPEEVIAQILKLHGYNTICAPIFSQYGAIEGLRNGWDEVEKMRVSYRQRRNLMHKALSDMGLPTPEPLGAFYLFPDITSTGLSSEEFATRLLQEHGVAVVPGDVFGACGEGHVRCCYATAIDKLKTALERMAQFVDECRSSRGAATSAY